jgi:hypothetical protein
MFVRVVRVVGAACGHPVRGLLCYEADGSQPGWSMQLAGWGGGGRSVGSSAGHRRPCEVFVCRINPALVEWPYESALIPL